MATDYPEARALMLAAVLPASTDVHIALWLGDPIAAGVELTLAGYARVAFQAWITNDLGQESKRKNTVAITFPTITDAGTADYWSIHDGAVEPSVLLRSGRLLDDLGQPVTIVLTGGGDDVQFNANALEIKVVEG